MSRCRPWLLMVGACLPAMADDALHASYLANAGVLIRHGETSIVFDPLFDQDYGTYELVPEDIEAALFRGEPPFDGLDAVFVSHHHGDHFSPERMLALLRAHPELQLFAPSQAIDAMPAGAALEGRLHAVSLDLDASFSAEIAGLKISAVRLPHSGWPKRHADVENIAFSVSLQGTAAVLHLGDAHTDPEFFSRRASYWAGQSAHLALPPYWYFLSAGGKKILEDHVRASEVIGVHVPASVPDSPAQYPPELKGHKLFSVPGEERRIAVAGEAE